MVQLPHHDPVIPFQAEQGPSYTPTQVHFMRETEASYAGSSHILLPGSEQLGHALVHGIPNHGQTPAASDLQQLGGKVYTPQKQLHHHFPLTRLKNTGSYQEMERKKKK